MNFLAALLSAEGAAEALLPMHRRDCVFLTDLQQAVKIHIPAHADAAAVDEQCLLPALQVSLVPVTCCIMLCAETETFGILPVPGVVMACLCLCLCTFFGGKTLSNIRQEQEV